MQTNKRYWLRSALILAFIHAFVFVVLVGSVYLKNKNVPAQYEPWPATMIMVIPDFPVFVFLDNPIFAGNGSFYVFLFGTLQWFIIGAIIGWIYGKIKNRNKV